MLLASAMRHSVGRPAHGNGGRFIAYDLRAKAVALVNESKGYISLDTARKHKVPLQLEDDMEAEDDGW